MTKKTLSSIKVEEQTISNIKTAIKKYNLKNLVQMTENEFRRLSYELLSQLIIKDMDIPIQLRE